MGKRKGPPKKNALADMGIYPEDDCYQPPPKKDCESIPIVMDLDDGHRLHFTRYYRRGTSEVVSFGINQSVRLPDGEWCPVARIDSWHNEVHRHQFGQDGQNRTETLEPLIADTAVETINRWYERAQRIMLEEWTENLRRWAR